MKKLIAGNWKMNGSRAGAEVLCAEFLAGLSAPLLEKVDFCVCPPAPYLAQVRKSLPSEVWVGGQDCSQNENGAFTGDISAEMLKDIGASHVILGHSERRQYHKEADILISQKIKKAHDAGLVSIVCVGETEAERESGKAEDVVIRQIRDALPSGVTPQNTVIAYEPVWAIGTGKTPSPDDVTIIHAVIRQTLQEKLDNSAAIRILYGGSVKPENAAILLTLPNVDGALVGGASLKADQFIAIAVYSAGLA